jgi:membrane protease YdiL (CAAX protease family)
MSGPSQGPAAEAGSPVALARSWLSLFVATAFFGVMAFSPYFSVAILVAMVAITPPVAASLGWGPLRLSKLWEVFAIFVPFALAWMVFATGYLRLAGWLGAPIEPQAQLLQFAAGDVTADEFWPMVVSITILAPVSEEVLFRGYLFGALLGVMPLWAVHLVTATLFGLAHGLEHALPIAVLSLLFGYLRQRYRSLWPSILAHMLHNSIILALVCAWPGFLDLYYNR